LLTGTGVVTALPLLAFAAAARMLPLSVLGIVQYLSPTLQFLIGVIVFREPFSREKLVAFAFIWAALIVFSVEGWLTARRRRADPTAV
jgi:chloramphenicol-sensitive protein RarD